MTVATEATRPTMSTITLYAYQAATYFMLTLFDDPAMLALAFC